MTEGDEGSGGKEFPLSIWMRQLNESQMGSEQQEGRLHEMSAPLIWPPRSPAAKTRAPSPRVLKCWAVARCFYLLTTFGFKPSQVRSFLLPLSSSHKLRLLSLFVFSRTKYDHQSNVHRVYNPLSLLSSARLHTLLLLLPLQSACLTLG